MIALLLADRCTACQRCVQVCPRNVFDAGPAGLPPAISRAEDCHTCFACELYCRADALYVEPTAGVQVPVDEQRVRAAGLLGVYRRDSGWDEWADDPAHPNLQHRMSEVFARGYAAARALERGDAEAGADATPSQRRS